MQSRYPPQEYIVDRFRDTTRIWLPAWSTISLNRAAGTARVDVTVVEYRIGAPAPRTFVGSWDLVLRNRHWLLDDPHF